MSELDELLQDAIAAAQAGKKQKAKALLQALLKARPSDIAAWKCLSTLVESDQEKDICLDKIRRIHAAKVKPPTETDESQTTPLSEPSRERTNQISLRKIGTQTLGSRPRRRRRKKRHSKRYIRKKKITRWASLLTIVGAIALIFLVLADALLSSKSENSASLPISEDRDENEDYVTGRLGLVPMRIALSPANLGWQTVTITLAYENRSNSFEKLSYSTKNATLFTKEGYTYPAQLSYVNEASASTVSLSQEPLWLPPGFRFWSTYTHNELTDVRSFYKIQARIAQNTTPSLVSIAGYGDLDLQNISHAALEFPIAKEIAQIETIGHSMTLPRKQAKLTVTGIKKKPFYFDRTGPRSDLFIVTVLQENLDAGYDTKVPFFTIGINGEGIVGSLPLTTQNTLKECSLFPTLGPSQSATVTGCTVLPEDSKDVRIVLAIKTNIAYEFIVLDSGY